MKANKKLGIYVCMLCFFLLYLINANKLVVMLTSDGYRFAPIEASERANQSIIYYDYTINIDQGSPLELVDITGWSFAETDTDNADKFINIILNGRNYSYSLKTELSSRDDMQNTFPNLSIRGYDNGFSSAASPLLLKDDVYEILIYNWENEQAYGYVRTGVQLVKDKTGIREYSPEKLDKEISAQLTNHIQYSVDIDNQSNPGVAEIDGWAYLENAETLNQEVYLEVSDPVGHTVLAETSAVARRDVAVYFDNPIYENGGFLTTIPQETPLQGDTLFFTPILSVNGSEYRSNIVSVYIIDDAGFWQSKTRRIAPTIGHPAILPLTFDIPVDQSVSGYIDHCELDKNGYIYIMGWCYQEGVISEQQSVLLQFMQDGKILATYEADRYERPDLAERFGSEYALAGFHLQIPPELFEETDGVTCRVIIGTENQYLQFEKEEQIHLNDK